MRTLVRLVLTAFLLVAAYPETGPFTTATLALLVMDAELTTLVLRRRGLTR